MAARLEVGAITPSDIATFSMPIDSRPQISPPLPANCLGNLAVYFKLGESVQNLVAPENLRAMASQICTGVKSVDDRYLKNFIALLQQVLDVGQVFIDYFEHIKTTGLFLTSWTKFDYAAVLSVSEWELYGWHCRYFPPNEKWGLGGYIDVGGNGDGGNGDEDFQGG